MLPLVPPSPLPAHPPAVEPRKRFIVQARSEASEAWLWLVCSAASETLTFLQGLHLELVSCSGCAGQGRSLARHCDWARLSLYGPHDGWDCQTVICQSLAYRFKPEHNARESLWLVQKASDASVFYKQSSDKFSISQFAEPIERTKMCHVLYLYLESVCLNNKLASNLK